MPPYPHLDPGPYSKDGNDDLGVLLVHGYTGTPTELRPVADHLHGLGCTISAPLLPGHGTHHRDLERVTRQDWLGAVDDAYAALAKRVRRVAVLGQSLGGLLALHLAARTPSLAGIVVMAPAMRVSRIAQLTRLPLPLRFLPKFEERRPDLVDVSGLRDVWSYTHTPLRPVREVLALQNEVDAVLGSLSAPLLVLQGAHDRTVIPQEARKLVARTTSLPSRLVWLEHSGHILGVDGERSLVCAEVGKFLVNRGLPDFLQSHLDPPLDVCQGAS